MISMAETAYYISDCTNPYKNMAVEKYLAVHTKFPVLYLWRNACTVVIGKNQNSYCECDVNALYSDGGRLARRYSGGGAVYHDLGNLNFSFLAHGADYNTERQYEAVRRAVASFGLSAEITGRNDLTVGGRKFSGNAFFQAGENRCHHGTLLIKTDADRLAKYLTVSREKLHTKGVESVSSRVVNLGELCSGITPDTLSEAMLRAFNSVYGGFSRRIPESELDLAEISEYETRLSSDSWIFTSRVSCGANIKRRFLWGGVEIAFTVSGKRMSGVKIYSDAMDARLIELAGRSLENAEYTPQGVSRALGGLDGDENILKDIGRAIYESI